MKIHRYPHEYISGFHYEDPVTEIPLITHCGEACCMPGLNLKPHRHFGFEFIYLASGKMDWKVGGQTFAQSGGDLFVAYPDELHESDCPSREQTYQHWIGLHLGDLGAAGNRLIRLLGRDQVRIV